MHKLQEKTCNIKFMPHHLKKKIKNIIIPKDKTLYMNDHLRRAKLGQTKPLKRDPWFSFFFPVLFWKISSSHFISDRRATKLTLLVATNFGNEANKEWRVIEFFVNWAWGHFKCHVIKKVCTPAILHMHFACTLCLSDSS